MNRHRLVKGRLPPAAIIFDIVNHLALLLLAILCVMPLVHILAVSLSDRSAVAAGFVGLWPIGFTTVAYRAVLGDRVLYDAFVISVKRTLLGTTLNMVLTVLTAYPLSKTAQEFKGRQLFMWMVLFAMLFSGGLIPWFLVIRRLGLLNTVWALVLPNALPIWNVILLMNFFREVPKELDEAAMIDGASHWRRLEAVYLPFSSAALATLMLFAAVNHWNAWFDGMVLMWDASKYPLQYYVKASHMQGGRAQNAARIVVAALPILVIYPLLQRYFVAGIRLGAIKG